MEVAHRNGLVLDRDHDDGHRRDQRRAHRAPADDPRRAGPGVANGYADDAVESRAPGSAGFRAFIPWTYQPENNHLKGRTQATTLEYLRLIAVARLFFDNVAHLQASWLTTGKDVGQLSLHMGVDDLGSIMLEENVISSAGARHRSNLHELIWMIRTADRIPAQRDTLYRHLAVHRTPADDPTDERVVSHFSSIALPGGGAGRTAPAAGRASPDRRCLQPVPGSSASLADRSARWGSAYR